MMIDKSQIFSVSDASRLIKGVMESAFGEIKIRGELSQISRAASGHTYMTIKDETAAMSAIVWRGMPLPFALENGIEIVATGKITTYPARSNYQLIISSVEMAGAGAILKMLEDRKQKLAADGLFDVAKKRALPAFPKTIGIITSPTGAAVRDILSRLQTRFVPRVIIYPAVVQGEAAAREVIAGIEFFNRAATPDRPDVLIIARGGGSLEDLLPFSDEALVRAVAASNIPTISGVGHEPDFMLIDFAADWRAPTPTAAAEAAARERRALADEINAKKLTNPRQLIAEKFQRLDDISKVLNVAFAHSIGILRQRILGQTLRAPGAVISDWRGRIINISTKMNLIISNQISRAKMSLEHRTNTMDNLSYKNTLKRGFAIVKSGGKIVSRAADFATPAEIIFQDDVVKIN